MTCHTMIYQKIIKKSIVYLLMASMLFNTGISGLTSIMDINKTAKKSIVKVSHQLKSNSANQIQTVADSGNPGLDQQATAAGNDNSSPKPKATQPEKSVGASLPVGGTQYQILVRVIHAEAGGESLKGQVAVAAVLLNRIRSGKFPKSISANVFRGGEFESVSNGYIWSEPTSSAYQAAKLALQGWDPTYGALYFYNPAKTYTSWIWSRPIHTRIGNHNFAG